VRRAARAGSRALTFLSRQGEKKHASVKAVGVFIEPSQESRLGPILGGFAIVHVRKLAPHVFRLGPNLMAQPIQFSGDAPGLESHSR